MTERATLVLVHREGDTLVIIDAADREYVCKNGDELWKDLHSIVGDPALPAGTVSAGQSAEASGEQLFDAVCQQVQDAATEQYGGFLGNVAGRVARNGGTFAGRLLRTISRNNKRRIG
jgi:hypothetical protein